VVVDDALYDSYESDSVASLLEGRFAPRLLVVNVPVDAIVLTEGAIGNAGPDCSVNEIFVELQNAQCDELGIGRLSPEEKLHLDLLHILKSHRLLLNIFSPTLKFAVKVNASGVVLLSDVVPSRESVMWKVFDHCSMHSLEPRQKLCLLPIAKRHVNMVYFDASAVFASLLSCPVLNQDHKYMLYNGMSLFAVSLPTNLCGRNYVVGEINTGRIYRATYAELEKDPHRDMLLPCILGMDKTHVDTSTRLYMEPVTVSHGLLKQEFRSLPSAMRILG
jgi:Plavaka transposase